MLIRATLLAPVLYPTFTSAAILLHLRRARPPMEDCMSQKLMSFKRLREYVPLSRTQITRLEKAGKFPRRVRLGPYSNSRVAWPQDPVLKWIDDRIKRYSAS